MSMMKTVYNIHSGPVEMYAVDAQNAVQHHPLEWSLLPWSDEDASKARAELRKRHERKVADAERLGVAPPPPLPPDPLPPTDEERAAIDEDAKRRLEAKERLEAAAKEEAERKAKEDQLKADKALIAQAPPRPDPNAPRRPFGRKGEPTDAEKQLMQKQAEEKADRDRVVKEKTDTDKIAGAKTQP